MARKTHSQVGKGIVYIVLPIIGLFVVGLLQASSYLVTNSPELVQLIDWVSIGLGILSIIMVPVGLQRGINLITHTKLK